MTDPDPTDPVPRASTDHEREEREQRALFWEAAGHAFRPYAGWAFYGFGALLVLLGYLGVSGESVVAKQLPYLISGGIGGLLLAVLGAYFLGIEELRKDGGRLDRMEKQVAELHRALLDRADAPQFADAVDADVTRIDGGAERAPATHVVTVADGESFHRASCALVAGKDTTRITRTAALDRDLRPCPVCEPSATVA